MPPEPRILLSTSRFEVVEHTQFIGERAHRVQRQVVVHPGSVVILPLLDNGCVCLIRNFRIAVDKILIELPAGTLDHPDESPLESAQRELREETGFTAARWQSLPGFFMSPGILNERMHLFVAQGLTPGTPAREAGEQIENLLVPCSEAIGMIERGEVEDGKTVAALLLWHHLQAKS